MKKRLDKELKRAKLIAYAISDYIQKLKDKAHIRKKINSIDPFYGTFYGSGKLKDKK
ncbi:hypothetical protein [Campylobacter sp.]|uniref:hypothetical protein n=1 Tax=Campylobacter sp. TaxID=205 RepID=UPI002708DA53|nr:hypothetical protein [Campylobacter sp.]